MRQPDPFALPTGYVVQSLFWPVQMHSWFDAYVRLLPLSPSPWADGPGVQVENLIPPELQLPVRYGSLLV